MKLRRLVILSFGTMMLLPLSLGGCTVSCDADRDVEDVVDDIGDDIEDAAEELDNP